MINWEFILEEIKEGNLKSLARSISLVENEYEGFEVFLQSLPINDSKKIVGITGPPGAGKSTLVDTLIGEIVNEGKKVCVICIDPSSPFHHGAVLGDRVRMSQWYNHPGVFIRSLSSRGNLGGLHPKILEITDLLKTAPFDYIIVETVGVGQSEVEIAELADTTVVVVVPEAGDDIQMMKAGLLEVADIFVVNKSDRPDADRMVKNLQSMIAINGKVHSIPVLKTAALQKQGVRDLLDAINKHNSLLPDLSFKLELLAKKAVYLIRHQRMKDLDQNLLKMKIEEECLKRGSSFNLYRFVNEKRYE